MFISVYQHENMFRIYCQMRKFRWYVYIYFQIFKNCYVYECSAYMLVWAPPACLLPTENKRRCQVSWNSEPTRGCWESNTGPLEGQPALLTDELPPILLYQKSLLSGCACSRLSSYYVETGFQAGLYPEYATLQATFDSILSVHKHRMTLVPCCAINSIHYHSWGPTISKLLLQVKVYPPPINLK